MLRTCVRLVVLNPLLRLFKMSLEFRLLLMLRVEGLMCDGLMVLLMVWLSMWLTELRPFFLLDDSLLSRVDSLICF